jgi:hypothetical protein
MIFAVTDDDSDLRIINPTTPEAEEPLGPSLLHEIKRSTLETFDNSSSSDSLPAVEGETFETFCSVRFYLFLHLFLLS